MFILHTMKGQEVALNGGLIERVEQDTETHITLATGTSYIVREDLDEVIRLHREDRAKVRIMAHHVSDASLDDVGDESLQSGVVQLFPGPRQHHLRRSEP